MIFSMGNHIELIIKGEKTQTRRTSGRYEIGKTYAIQPKRTAKGISQGRIMIVKKKCEGHAFNSPISAEDAKAEGSYTSRQFEALYTKLHPCWTVRFAYTFTFCPTIKRRLNHAS